MEVNAQVQLIGKILLDRNLLAKNQLDEFAQQIKNKATPQTQQDLESFLINKNIISEETLLKAYSEHLNIAYLDLSRFAIDQQAVLLIPAKFAHNHKVIGIKKESGVLTVALRDPFDVHIIDELKVLTKLSIKPVISKSEDIANAIKIYYGVGAETVEMLVKDAS
jgi:type IV pilus assembly protein PilB